jgi:signal transduction histidine kinase
MTTLRLASIFLLLLALLSAGAEAAAQKRVLIIHSFGRDFAPDAGTASTLRAELTQSLRQPVALQEASLDVERGGGPENEGPLVEYLLRRSRDAPPDLVIAFSAPAMFFALRHRDALFPDRPLLVSGVDRRWFEAIRIGARDRVVTLGARDRAVTMGLDFLATARHALELLPDTTTIALVMGTSRLEQIWAKDIQLELAPLGDRVRVLPADALTLEQMRQRVGALPPNSAVIYGMFAVGADGAQYENELALVAIRDASSAPIFGIYESHLGNGIVGGSLVDARQIGSVTAELAVRMLRGESTGESSVNVPQQAPAFDWRELQRWGIPESRLPPGAEVRFRPPSLWEQHKLLITATAAIVLLQAALIIALLVQHARRRRAEKESVHLGGRLLTAHEDERKHLARELHDDLTQRLARLAINAGRMENAPAAPEGIRPLREDLVRLSEDVHALSYRLHPSVLDDLGLVEALKAECDRVARHGALRVEVDARGVPEALPNDASLCLFRVAQEALGNAVRHAGASAVSVLLSPSGKGLQLAVSDNGSGFDPARSPDHASLGLASMRERVRLLQGELDIESTPGRGTTVVAWVPA